METNVKAIELRDLWRRYKNDGDLEAREREMVLHHLLVVIHLVLDGGHIVGQHGSEIDSSGFIRNTIRE